MGYLAFEIITNADEWVDQPFNAHISGSGGLEQAGKILDRNDEILAQTIDGNRIYNESESVRKALLHVVGDNSLNISTAAQSMYRSELTGYSLIWGLNMPQSLRTSNNIKLTVDAKTCEAAYNVLAGFDKKGACVVYNYETGEVICSISTLAYDPQAPPEITEENESEYDGVYLDNVLSSTYTPGSIFKIITSAAAIENLPDVSERTWNCTGTKEIGGNDITCVEPHGTINFEQAMAYSCNVVYAELAVEVGAEKMTEIAKKSGINKSFEVDGVKTAKGNYDVSQASVNQLAWSGVGQYNDQVNPMQMAIICGAIANGGKSVSPRLVKNASDDFLRAFGLGGSGNGERLFNENTAEKLDKLMRFTISDYYGDAPYGGLTVCAKTGTAEVGENKEPNAWIVGYAQDEDCPLAFACVVEDAGFGSQYAAPVAQAAMVQAAKSLGASAVE